MKDADVLRIRIEKLEARLGMVELGLVQAIIRLPDQIQDEIAESVRLEAQSFLDASGDLLTPEHIRDEWYQYPRRVAQVIARVRTLRGKSDPRE